MSTPKYNAFISYKHADLDNKVAKEIQNGLEHFSIPGKIKKKYGIKRFERIFRDLEELPITSDLNDDIEQALANSDYLIVICSTNTKKSTWVEKEIATFLKTHTKDHIFTVLADGEPEDVIPEVLKHKMVTRKLADGSEVTMEEYLEPLSCDYRLPVKQARRIELPRLAAPMIGCSYDELMNRRRQYRIKRIATLSCILAALLLLIIGYLTWSVLEIRRNLRNSLINESRYNAALATDYLEEHDRVNAVRTALTALPSYEGERPVTSEAMKVLNDALGTYMIPGFYDFADCWSYEMDEEIKDLHTSETIPRLAALDEYGNVRVWDTVTHEVVCDLLGEAIIQMASYEDNLYTLNADFFRVYDMDDMSLIYENEYGKDSFGISPVFSYMPGSDTAVIVDSTSITVIDIANDETEKVPMPGDVSYIDETITVSKDRRFLIFSAYSADGDMCYSADLETGKIIKLAMPDDVPPLASVIISSDYRVSLICNTGTSTISMATHQTDLTVDGDVYIGTFDAQTGSMIWEDRMTVNSKMKDGFIYPYSYVDANGSVNPCIICMISDMIRLYDPETGELVSVVDLPSDYVSAYSIGETSLLLLLEDGSLATAGLDQTDRVITTTDYGFQGDLIDSDVGIKNDRAFYYLLSLDERKIVEYSPLFYDDSYVALPELDGESLVADGEVVGTDCYLIADGILRCYDLNSNEEEWDMEIAGVSYNYTICGYDDATNTLVIKTNEYSDDPDFPAMQSSDYKFILVDCEEEEIRDVICEPDIDPNSITTIVYGSKIYAVLSDIINKDTSLFIYDLDEEDSVNIDLGEFGSSSLINCFEISPDGRYANILIKESDSHYVSVLVDIEEEEALSRIESETVQSACFSSEAESDCYYLINRNEIKLMTYDGDETVIAETQGRVPIGSTHKDGILYVVYTNGEMLRYDANGNVISTTELDPGELSESISASFRFTDIGLMLRLGGYTDLIATTDLADPDLPGDYGCYCTLVNCIGYSEETKKFVISQSLDAESAVACYDYKDYNTLIQEAYEYLGV